MGGLERRLSLVKGTPAWMESDCGQPGCAQQGKGRGSVRDVGGWAGCLLKRQEQVGNQLLTLCLALCCYPVTQKTCHVGMGL